MQDLLTSNPSFRNRAWFTTSTAATKDLQIWSAISENFTPSQGKRNTPCIDTLCDSEILHFRLDTLDDLDSIAELKDADELKNKLLFSVIVVSQNSEFRVK